MKKVDSETVKRLVEQGRTEELVKICASLVREAEIQKELNQSYLDDLRKLKEAYKSIEEERDRFRRVCGRLRDMLRRGGLEKDYEAAWEEYDLTAPEAEIP